MHSKYIDIIDDKTHLVRVHKRMSNIDRANQFAPFAALKGHEDEMLEVARMVDDKIILSDTQKQEINSQLLIIKDNLPQVVNFIYFKNDKRGKIGGKYVNCIKTVKAIDEVYNIIVCKDKTKIKINDILFVKCDELNI